MIEYIILIILIILSSLFSAIEASIMSINMIKAKTLLHEEKKGADTLYEIKKNPHKILITILFGNNIVNISATALATIIFTELFGSIGVGISTGVMTFLLLVFGAIIPKTIATQNSEFIALNIAKPIELLSNVLYPITKFFENISNFVLKILGSKDEIELSEDELKTIVTIGKNEGILNRETAEMMHNILEFKGTKVVDIMTPKVDITFIDGETKIKDNIHIIVKSKHSKYPVYSGNTNVILGILDIDDTLKYIEKKDIDILIKKIIRPAYFVPESKKIDTLLTEFEDKKQPLVIIVDEHSYVSGLVTVENILNEIVGDVFDKSKGESIFIKKINNKISEVDAKAPISKVNRYLNLKLKDDHFDTIAGYIIHKLQKIPKKGEKIKLRNATIEIDSVTEQGIKSVRIIKN
ncbi:MAG: hemolysin family protein [DPANN group archaeon]|nr:hemolysin family protein [DPANN group archaeon]